MAIDLSKPRAFHYDFGETEYDWQNPADQEAFRTKLKAMRKGAIIYDEAEAARTASSAGTAPSSYAGPPPLPVGATPVPSGGGEVGGYGWAQGLVGRRHENYLALTAKKASIAKYAAHKGWSNARRDVEYKKEGVYDVGTKRDPYDPTKAARERLKTGKTVPYKIGTVKEFKEGGKVVTKRYTPQGKWEKMGESPRWAPGKAGEGTSLTKNIQFLVKSGIAGDVKEAHGMVRSLGTMTRNQFLMTTRQRLEKPDFMGDMMPPEELAERLVATGEWYDANIGVKEEVKEKPFSEMSVEELINAFTK